MNDKPVYEFTANETPIKTPHEKLTAGDIIRLAIKQGASGVSGKVGGKRMFKKWTRPVSVAATLFVLLCSAALAQEGESMLTRKIERQGEEFVVQVSKDQGEATVTGQHGVEGGEVTIRPNSGNFDVRLSNGWGGWSPTMDAAVEYAVRLYFEARSQLTSR